MKTLNYTIMTMAKRVLVNRIIVREQLITFNKLNDSMRIIAYADPSETDNTRLIYRSMDESIAIANNNGIVTSVGYGSTDIVILSADGNTEALVRVHVVRFSIFILLKY